MSISSSTRRAIKKLPWRGILIDGIDLVIDKRHHDLVITLNGDPIWRFYHNRGKYASTYYAYEHNRRLLKFFRAYIDYPREKLHDLVHSREFHTLGTIKYENWNPTNFPPIREKKVQYGPYDLLDEEIHFDPYDLLDILLAADRRIALWRLGRLLLITNCAVTRRIIGYRYEQKETPPHNLHGG